MSMEIRQLEIYTHLVFDILSESFQKLLVAWGRNDFHEKNFTILTIFTTTLLIANLSNVLLK